MALIGAVYKWRLDCDSYVYIIDYNGIEPLIITGSSLEENSEQNIKDIVSTWDERTYCEKFNEMVNYVHSFDKWKDLRFLDCNVYLKEYYGCEDILKPDFPTGIELNLSATSVEYYAQPEATVLDVKCITRDGEKIISYDINFGIPKGIPGLTLKGIVHELSDFETIESQQHNNINDAYLLEPLFDNTELPAHEQKGALYVYRGPDYSFPDTSFRFGSFEYISNIRGPRGFNGEGTYRYNEETQSYMFGSGDIASGLYSFSNGRLTVASGPMSTAEGSETKAIGDVSHAEGDNTKAEGYASHAEGNATTAQEYASHAEGDNTKAEGYASHAEGNYTIAQEYASHAEGDNTKAEGYASHAEGYNSVTGGDTASNTLTSGDSTVSGAYAHAEGNATMAQGVCSHSEGKKTFASGNQSHAEGNNTIANSNQSHAEGYGTKAMANGAHAEGDSTIAYGKYSHTEGANSVTGYEGTKPTTNNLELPSNTYDNVGGYAHAEGSATLAVGKASHSEGNKTFASGVASHAEGNYTIATNQSEHSEGKYNKSNTGTISSIGIGTSETDRKNAFEVMNNGDLYIKDIGNYNGILGENSKSLQQYLLEKEIKVVNVYELSDSEVNSNPTTWIDADLYHYCDNKETNVFFITKSLSSSNYEGLKPNTFYHWINPVKSNGFHISFFSYDVNEYSEYMVEFSVETTNTPLSFGQINGKNIVFTENSILQTIGGKTYQLSVLNNIGILINA